MKLNRKKQHIQTAYQYAINKRLAAGGRLHGVKVSKNILPAILSRTVNVFYAPPIFAE
jgi:hypothetical protein